MDPIDSATAGTPTSPAARPDAPGAAPAPGPLPAAATTAATAVAPPPPLGSSGSSGGTLLAGLLLAALAVTALVLARRRKRTPRLLEIVETASLGPKRSLVLARIGDDLLVLGSSEGGISLLSTRPAPVADHSAAAALASPLPESPPSTGRGLDLLARLRRPRTAPAFDAALAESAEDVELRRKLAAGQAGRVP